jgi:hypothetical protein
MHRGGHWWLAQTGLIDVVFGGGGENHAEDYSLHLNDVEMLLIYP